MSSVDPYINLIIALLGLAYPILLQVIARLDENYESYNITELFKKEWEWIVFRYMLVYSFISVLIWSLNQDSFVQIVPLNLLTEESAILLVLFNTIFLVASFFFFVRKVMKYYTLYSLIPYLIKKHEKSDSDVKYIPALSDLLLLRVC